jgi:hypothetical protein
MPRVKLPNGKTASFPESMSMQDIQSAIESDPNSGALPAGATGSLPGVPTPSRNLNYVANIDSPTNLVSGAWSGIKNLFTPQTVAGMGQPFMASGMAPGGIYPTTAPMGMGDTGKTSLRLNTQAQGAAQQQQGEQGMYAVSHPMETIGNVAGPALLTAGLTKAVRLGVPAFKGAITGDVNAPIPGQTITPAERFAAMKSMGINPDAAEATNSPFLKTVKKVNQNSLTAAPIYERTAAGNVQALQDFTGNTLDTMSPLSPEEGGAAVQKGLLRHQGELKQAATTGFNALDTQVGDKPIPGAKGLQQQAKNIVAQNAEYYRLHPELEPTRATAIVKDLARGGPATKPAPKVVPGFGAASATPPAAVPPRVPTYTELHRLRSDLLDFNNTNPDLVKNQSNAWISQLAGAADQAITSGEGGLTPDQVQTFRTANEAWKTMKGTYDNPQSPLYSAARTAEPSRLVGGISKTPEMARTLTSNLTPQEVGPIQRGVAEGALKTTAQGPYNFRTFQGTFNRLAPDYKQALYTPQQLESLNNIGQAGSVLNTDLNPSGSAKLGQGIGEAGAMGASLLHPVGLAGNVLYHGAQHLIGRAMNNPAVVNALMRSSALTPPTPGLYPGLFGAAATAGAGNRNR